MVFDATVLLNTPGSILGLILLKLCCHLSRESVAKGPHWQWLDRLLALPRLSSTCRSSRTLTPRWTGILSTLRFETLNWPLFVTDMVCLLSSQWLTNDNHDKITDRVERFASVFLAELVGKKSKDRSAGHLAFCALNGFEICTRKFIGHSSFIPEICFPSLRFMVRRSTFSSWLIQVPPVTFGCLATLPRNHGIDPNLFTLKIVFYLHDDISFYSISCSWAFQMTAMRNHSEERDPSTWKNRTGWTCRSVKKEIELCLDNNSDSDWVWPNFGFEVWTTIHKGQGL